MISGLLGYFVTDRMDIIFLGVGCMGGVFFKFCLLIFLGILGGLYYLLGFFGMILSYIFGIGSAV